jgi:hypothetical protein
LTTIILHLGGEKKYKIEKVEPKPQIELLEKKVPISKMEALHYEYKK